jgi:hypothetical protein
MIEAKNAAEAAAKWWAEAIGAPEFKATGENDSGEDRFTMGMAGALAGILADRHPVSQAQAQEFVKELTKIIEERQARCAWRTSLATDYGPDFELAKAADAAGVNSSRFPWKTHMAIRPDHVIVSAGYGAPDKLIWHEPSWQRPTCDSMRYDESFTEALDELCSLPRYHAGDGQREHDQWRPDPSRCKECGLPYSGHRRASLVKWTHCWEAA